MVNLVAIGLPTVLLGISCVSVERIPASADGYVSKIGIVAEDGASALYRNNGPELDFRTDQGRAIHVGEQLHAVLETRNGQSQTFAHTTSQGRGLALVPSRLASRSTAAVPFAVHDSKMLLALATSGYMTGDRRFDSICTVNLDDRGKRPNRADPLPEDRQGSYEVVAARPQGKSWIVLVAHSMGTAPHNIRLEAYGLDERFRRLGRSSAGPFRQVADARLTTRLPKGDRTAGMSVEAFDPLKRKILLHEAGVRFQEISVVSRMTRPVAPPSRAKSLIYIQGSLFANVETPSGYTVMRLGQDGAHWRTRGRGAILAVSASGVFAWLRDDRGVWKARLVAQAHS